MADQAACACMQELRYVSAFRIRFLVFSLIYLRRHIAIGGHYRWTQFYSNWST